MSSLAQNTACLSVRCGKETLFNEEPSPSEGSLAEAGLARIRISPQAYEVLMKKGRYLRTHI